MPDDVTFSFGQNWSDYVSGLDEKHIQRAMEDIRHWLGNDAVRGSSVLDIGSGSGIHSLSFLLLGAAEVHSFDYDPKSVAATKRVRESCENPSNWVVEQGSILDSEYVSSLGTFDIVYSWGVLHHTGDMWEALENTVELVRPGGLMWVALYQKGGNYEKHLALKKRYNRASTQGKRMMEWRAIGRVMLSRLRRLKNPFAWNERKSRGMNVYHDIRDWLGGLPYEVAGEDEVVRFGLNHGLTLRRIHIQNEGGCSTYIFRRESKPERR